MVTNDQAWPKLQGAGSDHSTFWFWFCDRIDLSVVFATYTETILNKQRKTS